MTTFLDLVTVVVYDLHHGGFINYANDLQQLANQALDKNLSDDNRRNAFIKIDARCHIKWFGDYYLPHLSQKDWWGRLEKLSKSTKKTCIFLFTGEVSTLLKHKQ